MKKILSIMVALGMVMGMFVMATPVAAIDCPDDCSPIAIDDALGPPDFCSGSASNYVIGPFTTCPVTLTPPNDRLSVDFPDGTDLSAVVAAGVFVNGNPVPSVVIDGTHIDFPVPVAAGVIVAGAAITIQINGVVNPAAGTQCLYVDYQLVCCDPVVFDCGTYTVSPAIHALAFVFDFSPTYTGVAEDFVPPFKACGQDGYGTYNASVGWLTDFDLILTADPPGCAAPCASANFWFVLEACPAGEVVTFLDPDGNWHTLTDADVGIVKSLTAVALPALWVDIIWSLQIHFSSPGEYQLCFYLECPSVPCGPGPAIVAERCLDAVVYQWKDAWCIELCPKWNLISLPLYPFSTDIADVLAPLARPDQLMSVWYFDQCADPDPDVGDWDVYPGDLDTMVAGNAYWMRTCHPGDPGYDPGAFPLILWVWGNHAPMPPADPMGSFDVCEGWNMVGFKPPWVGGVPQQEWDDLYLWNFWDTLLTSPDYGTIYEWDATVQDWIWYYPMGCQMDPGEGYWIPFSRDGEIYPKA